MVDSTMVLKGQTIAYTLYCIVIILLMVWFGLRITRGESKLIKPLFFYIWMGFLTVLVFPFTSITYNTIPWTPMDLNRSDYGPDKTFKIIVEDHQFILPSDKLIIDCNDLVLFDVTSNDLTYGFGLFRQSHSCCPDEVVPGHRMIYSGNLNKPVWYT